MENMINLVEHIVKGYLLKESLSSMIYHYTLIPNLSSILISECFELSDAEEKGVDNEYQHPTKRFFMSFTRQKNSRLGYAQERNVRLTIDGNLLSSNYEGHPIDYFAYMNPNKGGKMLHNKISPYMDNLQKQVEAEDRLFSNKRYIKHLERYIERIDILVDEDWPLEEEDVLGTTKYRIFMAYITKFLMKNIQFFVYNNRKDFRFTKQQYYK